MYKDYLPQEHILEETNQSNHTSGSAKPAGTVTKATSKTHASSAAEESVNFPHGAVAKIFSTSDPDVPDGDTRISDVAMPSGVGQHHVQDERQFRDSINLPEAVSTTEFPLGSYRKPNPPQDLVGGAYPSVQFDNSYPPDVSPQKTPTGEGIRTNSMGLGVPAFENSYGLSAGVGPAPGMFTRYLAEREGQSENSNGNWGEASLDRFELESGKSWSRVVGVRQGVEQSAGKDTPTYEHRSELKFTDVSLHDTSFGYDDDEDDMDKQFPLRPSDEFIHQSQVDSDSFQPYGGGGIAKAAAVQDRGWVKEEDVESRRRNASKKLREVETKSLVAVGRSEELADGNHTSSSLVGSGGLPSWSSPRVDRNAKATKDHSVYGLELNVNGDPWKSSSELNPTRASIMASAFAAATTTTTPGSGEGGKENAMPGGYQPIAGLGRPSSKNAEDFDIFSDYGLAAANRSSNGVRDWTFSCLLCYTLFENAEELGSHCSTSAHMEIAMLDSGAEKVWQYAPPPPGRVDKSLMRVCSK